MKNYWKQITLEEVLSQISRPELIEPEKEYNVLGMRWYARGLYIKAVKRGSNIRAKTLYKVKAGDFVYNRLFAWKGSFGVVDNLSDGCYVSNEFPRFEVNTTKLDARFLNIYFSQEPVWYDALGLSSGSTPISRNRLKEAKFLSMTIPLPPLEEQRRIVARIEQLTSRIEEAKALRREAVEETQLLVVSARYSLIFPEKANNWETILFNKAVDKLRGPNAGLHKKEYKSSGKFPVIDQGKEYIGGYTNDESRVFKVAAPVIVWGDHTTNSKLVDFDFVPGADGTKIFSPKEELLTEYVNQFLKTVNYPEMGYSRHYRHLKKQQIPVPSLVDQRRIVDYLDRLQSRVDELRKHQTETQEQIDALSQSILVKAFRGEL